MTYFVLVGSGCRRAGNGGQGWAGERRGQGPAGCHPQRERAPVEVSALLTGVMGTQG